MKQLIYDKDLIGYTAPDGSSISIHDYEFLSTAQQKQCKPFRKKDLQKLLTHPKNLI